MTTDPEELRERWLVTLVTELVAHGHDCIVTGKRRVGTCERRRPSQVGAEVSVVLAG